MMRDQYEPGEFLQQLSNELELNEKTGSAVNKQLADIVSKRWGKQLPQEKIKALCEKCIPPNNCIQMDPQIKVNKEVWALTR